MKAVHKIIEKMDEPDCILDINRAEVVKTGYRILKERGKSGARLRVPAGNLPAEVMPVIQRVAEKYGNGYIHLTSRQGIEILHVNLKDIPKIKEELAPAIKRMQQDTGGSKNNNWEKGYSQTGTRNIVSCVGNQVCPFANCDSSAFAQKVEKEVFEKPYYMKIGITACPNDCARARVMDVGIIAVVEPVQDAYRCVGCSRCADTCEVFCGAIEMKNEKAVRDKEKCIFCGECIKVCPTGSWKRGAERFDVVVGGRMGKRDPRISLPLIKFVDENAVIEIIRKTYSFIEKNIDRKLKNEFLGYIIDRVGFDKFKQEVL